MVKHLTPFSRRLIIEEILSIVKASNKIYTPEKLTVRLSVRSPFLSKKNAEDYIYLLLEDGQIKLNNEGLIFL